MDLDTFLNKLSNETWELMFVDKLSHRGPDNKLFCPITYVALKETGKYFTLCQYDEAARELGLDTQLSVDIVEAADNSVHHKPELRTKLLEACKLS